MTLDHSQLNECTTFMFDIEGTICSIAFVKDVLYPFFVTELPVYVGTNWNDEVVQNIISKLPAEIAREPQSATDHFLNLVRNDIKDPLLKELQGLVWTSGYRLGAITAPLYSDVVPIFSTVRSRNRKLAIYSSGSVHAQRLLFDHVDIKSFPLSSHSEDGAPSSENNAYDELTGRRSVSIVDYFLPDSGDQPLFFDTANAGPKLESKSYETIAKILNEEPSRIVFFTDNADEARAARVAGLCTVVVVRPGNAPLPDGLADEFPVVQTLKDLDAKLGR